MTRQPRPPSNGSVEQPENSESMHVVGGRRDCSHRRDERTYLGNAGASALYRCETCGGVVVATLHFGDESTRPAAPRNE